MIPLLVIPAAILCLLVITVIAGYNKLVGYKNRMQEAWSGIDVFLKKRHDLVPNLVAIVKAYASHEKEVVEEVTRLRSQAVQAKGAEAQMATEAGLGQALGRLMVVAEKYPDLKANTHFLELQKQLSAMEEELSLSRRYYNGTVRQNNICVERFPSNLIAGMFRFAKGKFFEIDSTEKSVSHVAW